MTTDILKERQSWTLAQKVDHSLATIDVFISRMGGIDKVYCSFSGGKDSTVLCSERKLLPDRCQYGRRQTCGNISRSNGWILPIYTTKAQRVPAAWVADSAHSSQTTAVSLFSSIITRRLTIW